MDKETINKAADEFANREYETSVVDRDYLHKGFYHGAHWRINSVWHEANKEIPIPFRPILVEHDDGRFSVNMVGGNIGRVGHTLMTYYHTEGRTTNEQDN